MVVLLIALTVVMLCLSVVQNNELCEFNSLCTCRKAHHEIICRGVPFSAFPTLPLETIYQVKILRSGMEILPRSAFEGSSVASLHLMQNNIIYISSGAFNGLENILTTLDLSNNQIRQFPTSVLSHLNNLQWLNLQGNHLEEIHSVKWSQLNSRLYLHSLFLGNNFLTNIQESAFLKLINLSVLDLEGNFIHDVGSHSFPHSLRSLSLANNILKKVPLHSIYALKNLRFLDLSGNLFKKLPCPFYLHVSRLEKMELSNNMLIHIPECVFNGSFTIKELHFDFNFIRSLAARSFKGTKLERLMLANNRISNIHSDAFVGLERTLTTLDLSFNLIEQFPFAINDLNALLYLSLKSNMLKGLGGGDMHGSRSSLEILDLSGNMLQHVPKKSLNGLTKLARLSLQDNRIHKVYRDDFDGWGQTLTTLSLANNKMTYLSGGAFAHLSKLKELKLSFNNLMHLDQNVFIPLRKTLEILDLSSAFSEYNHPPELFINGLSHLEWLQLDQNNISFMTAASVHSLTKLHHLDISNNDLTEFSFDLLLSSKHTYLSTVHISNNNLKFIGSGTFESILRLSTVILYRNKISNVESYAFSNCTFLHSIVLSNNDLIGIEKSAFHNLTRLSNLFLQDNHLESFSLEIIDGETSQLYLNLSNNNIKYLGEENSSAPIYAKVRTLDLTNNQISVIPDSFFEGISKYLLHLFMSKNYISDTPSVILSNLQVMHFSFNFIERLNNSDLVCCPNIQILKLDHNNISYVSTESFNNLSNLRILDLSNNVLSELDENAFLGTKLERLNLSGNNFRRSPAETLTKIRDTLRHLDLSLNHIENIFSGSFSRLNKLQALNLSSNHISFLQEKSFHHLDDLIELDLSHNPIKSIVNENPLSSLISLRYLYMRNTSLLSIASLPLPQLKYLDLKDNFIYNLSQEVFYMAHHIKHLDLSGNLLQDVPIHLWPKMSRLVSLDISHNPIEELEVNSFSGIERLQNLDISGLLLIRLDPRTLHRLKFLTTIKTDSYSSVRSFRLQDLLSHAPAVRKVTIKIEESTLSHQVQGAFGIKLRELVITGSNLQRILPDAFSGLSTHELTIRICGTSVSMFPDGLLRYLPDVRYLTLDLRNNQLAIMGPGVLAAIARDGPDIHQTQHISGGVLLEDNPWNCSCELLWLGRWLKRWLRETFHAHMLNVEAALYVNSVSRKATCSVSGSNLSLAIVDLRSSDVDCAVKINLSSQLIPKHGLVIFMAVLSSTFFNLAQTLSWSELNNYLYK